MAKRAEGLSQQVAADAVGQALAHPCRSPGGCVAERSGANAGEGTAAGTPDAAAAPGADLPSSGCMPAKGRRRCGSSIFDT
jgi:hypothetical protein